MIQAAGVMFLTTAGEVLLLRRALGDHVGEWAFPGGKVEGNETFEDAAIREVKEEIGFLPEGERIEWTRRQADGVDYVTFLQTVKAKFEPELDAEHSDWTWFELGEEPEADARVDEILIQAGSRFRVEAFDSKTMTMTATLVRSGSAKTGVKHTKHEEDTEK